MNKIQPGTYTKAKILDYGLSQSQTGTPCVFVQFSFNEGDEQRKLTWRSYFSDKAKAKTVETLVKVFGYKGNTAEDIANGIGSNALNESQEYELVIDKDEYNGEKHDKIKWVNLPGGGGSKIEKLDKSKASVLLGGMNLKAEFLSLRQAAPATKTVQGNEDDIPF